MEMVFVIERTEDEKGNSITTFWDQGSGCRNAKIVNGTLFLGASKSAEDTFHFYTQAHAEKFVMAWMSKKASQVGAEVRFSTSWAGDVRGDNEDDSPTFLN